MDPLVIIGMFIVLFILYQIIYYTYRRSDFKDKTIAKKKEYLRFELDGYDEAEKHCDTIGFSFILASIPLFLNERFIPIAFGVLIFGSLFLLKGIYYNFRKVKFSYHYRRLVKK